MKRFQNVQCTIKLIKCTVSNLNKWIQMYFSGMVNVISQESVSFSIDKFYKTFCHL